jgi:hypothetical protein
MFLWSLCSAGKTIKLCCKWSGDWLYFSAKHLRGWRIVEVGEQMLILQRVVRECLSEERHLQKKKERERYLQEMLCVKGIKTSPRFIDLQGLIGEHTHS